MATYPVFHMQSLQPLEDGIGMSGIVEGHPDIFDGEFLTTSRIESHKWLRTRLLVTTRDRTFHVKGRIVLFQELSKNHFSLINKKADNAG